MGRMKFLCDAERCIECNGCVTASKNEHEVPWGVNRRRVVTMNDGVPGERSISVACMHCSDAPCMAVCPTDCFYKTEDGVVLHDKDKCIGCGYCFYACPFGAPQFPNGPAAFGARGKMDKCTFCAGGPEETNSAAEYEKYGSNTTAIDPLLRKKTTRMARPMAASAAATVRMNMLNTCPVRSPKNEEKATKLILTASSINSMHIRMMITFLRFRKIPKIPMVNSMPASIR